MVLEKMSRIPNNNSKMSPSKPIRLRGDGGFSIPVSHEVFVLLVCSSGALFVILAFANWEGFTNIFRSDSDKILDAQTKCPIGYDLKSAGSCSPNGLTLFMGIVGVFFIVNLVILIFSWFTNDRHEHDDYEISLAQSVEQRRLMLSSTRSLSTDQGNSKEAFYVPVSDVKVGDEISFDDRRIIVDEIDQAGFFIRLLPEVGPAIVLAPKSEVVLYASLDDFTRREDEDADFATSVEHVEPDEVINRIYNNADEFEGKFRECPYCAEPIRARAIICRYCGHEVEPLD